MTKEELKYRDKVIITGGFWVGEKGIMGDYHGGKTYSIRIMDLNGTGYTYITACRDWIEKEGGGK